MEKKTVAVVGVLVSLWSTWIVAACVPIGILSGSAVGRVRTPKEHIEEQGQYKNCRPAIFACRLMPNGLPKPTDVEECHHRTRVVGTCQGLGR